MDFFQHDDEDLPNIANFLNEDGPPNIEDITVIEEQVKTKTLQTKIKPTSKSKKSKNDKEAEKMKRLEERARLKAEREKLKAEKEKLKAEKDLQKLALKATKPGEAIKYMKIEIDRKLLETTLGCKILSQLQEDQIRYNVTDSLVEKSVLFYRKDILKDIDNQEDYGLILVPMEELMQYINGSLDNICQKWKSYLNVNRIYLIISGFDAYFRGIKNAKNKKFKRAVLGENIIYTGDYLSREDVETVLLELSFDKKINYDIIEDPDVFSRYISQMTKSISEAPYKQMNDSSGDFSWSTEDTKNKMVKIDKSGVGLLKLWHQQLRQFPNVGVEVSQAIVSKYNSPFELYQTYRNLSTKEGELLLADISIRRGAGPLASSRKIGPELSKKIYKYFNEFDGQIIL